MEKYIDIHSHILPGVDDGARNIAESIAMLKTAQREGAGAIILTPHQKPEQKCVSVSGIRKRIRILQEEMKRQRIEIALFEGSELMFCHELREQLRKKEVCTLAGSRYILVEFFAAENWQYIRSGLYDLLCDGYFPIVAHLERYREVVSDRKRIQELIDMGCYIQINAESVIGNAGLRMKKMTAEFLREEVVHFVATDAHRESGKRSVQLKKCSAYLVKKYGKEYADRLLWKNAGYILRDEEF